MKYSLSALMLIIFFSCNTPGDVEPEERNTFVKVFGSGLNSTGYSISEVSDGYLIVGTALSDTLEYTTINKVDENGNTQWSQLFVDTNGQDFLTLDDGYLIVGDSIKRQGNDENVTKILLMKTDLQGNITATATIGDLGDDPRDYHGISLAKSVNNEIAVIGTRENETDQDEMVLAGFDLNLNQNWVQYYSLDEGNYEVGRNIHYGTDGRITWVSTSVRYNEEDNNQVDAASFSIPITLSNSENINNESYGQNSIQQYFAKDLQPILSGFAVIGNTNENGNSDMFYIRVNRVGVINETSYQIISSTLTGIPLRGNDEGNSLVGTSDGGVVLMGSIATTTEIGNGGKDIYLLKIDALGNPIWESIIGGSGDEIGYSIIESSDGSFVITGKNDFQGSSVALMIKTNNKGKLIE